jgi:outer membrane protein assembly factor BamD
MMRSSLAFRVALLVALALALPGCKTVGGWFGHHSVERTETLEVEQLYSEAKAALVKGDYSKANKYYGRLIARFPFGPYNEQAQLELAYVQYKIGKPEDATATVDRFIRTYPRHSHISYAYYLKAVINFDRNVGVLNRALRIDPSQRDLNGPLTSFNDFNEVLRRYPNSLYAQDARQRMVYLRNEMARHELVVGLYYLRRGAYVSAVNRGRYLLENFPQSESQGDAIALMAAGYAKLGQTALAEDSKRVLQQNYPDHPYLKGKWPNNESFLHKLNPFGGEHIN